MYLLITRTECPYCIKAKKLLQDSKTPHAVINLDKETEETQQQYRSMLKETFNHSTVPAVFKLVGGYNELAAIEMNLEELF
jgi:glutaredoxin